MYIAICIAMRIQPFICICMHVYITRKQTTIPLKQSKLSYTDEYSKSTSHSALHEKAC